MAMNRDDGDEAAAEFRNELARRFSPFPFHHRRPQIQEGTSLPSSDSNSNSSNSRQKDDEDEWDHLGEDAQSLDSFSAFKWFANRISTRLVFKNQIASMFQDRCTVDREIVCHHFLPLHPPSRSVIKA